MVSRLSFRIFIAFQLQINITYQKHNENPIKLNKMRKYLKYRVRPFKGYKKRRKTTNIEDKYTKIDKNNSYSLLLSKSCLCFERSKLIFCYFPFPALSCCSSRLLADQYLRFGTDTTYFSLNLRC